VGVIFFIYRSLYCETFVNMLEAPRAKHLADLVRILGTDTTLWFSLTGVPLEIVNLMVTALQIAACG